MLTPVIIINFCQLNLRRSFLLNRETMTQATMQCKALYYISQLCNYYIIAMQMQLQYIYNANKRHISPSIFDQNNSHGIQYYIQFSTIHRSMVTGEKQSIADIKGITLVQKDIKQNNRLKAYSGATLLQFPFSFLNSTMLI